MRKGVYYGLIAGFLFTGLLAGAVPASAADLFVRDTSGDNASSSQGESGNSKKLYVTPDPNQKVAPRKSAPRKTLYDDTGSKKNSRGQKPAIPEVSTGSELDRIQEENIRRAQDRATKNAQKIKEMEKQWDAERGAADEAAEKAYQEEQARQASAENAQSATDKKDQPTTVYKGDESNTGLKKPARTFNVFQ